MSLENDHGMPLPVRHWRTESVLLTRREAEDFAKQRSHNFPAWRVYCLPCDGELADLLRHYQQPQEASA